MKQPAHDVRGPVSIPSRANNCFGHIVEIVPPLVNGQPDHAATECDWGFFLLAGNPNDPTHGAHYPNAVSANGWVAAPDNVAFDPKGRIWISTDGQDDSAGFNDSLYAAQVSGPGRGATRRFFNGPRDSEICGPAFTPDGRTRYSSPCSTRATKRDRLTRNRRPRH